MKNLKILILLFLVNVNLLAQNTTTGKVTYKYNLNEQSFGEIKNQEIVEKFKSSLNRSRDKINYLLTFNEKESSYKIIKFLIPDNEKFLEYATLITGGTEEYYTNIVTKKRLKKIDFIGDKFIISSSIDKKWELTQESKRIGKYFCYKAKLKKSNNVKEAKIKLPEIEAWYCPKIPFRFGPKGYGDLPGLILELTVGPISYKASKIELNPKEEIDIIKPRNGKLISEKEFDNLLTRINKRKS